jgi:bifunctional dethiobiotin synthetase / adenosylmethionine---8-amino-7-oxononanoate aminotransferase
VPCMQGRPPAWFACLQVALAALDSLSSPELNQNMQPDGTLRDIWEHNALIEMSQHPAVKRVVPLGTVLAVELAVPKGAGGYASTVSRAVAECLRERGVYARPLGNVAYVMCTPTTIPEDAQWLIEQLQASIEAAHDCRVRSHG